jgi:hypothetical protein
MDDFDRAQELEMLQREAAIAQARMTRPGGPVYTGHCHYCEAALPSPRRFCDGECREGWEQEQAALYRNGKPLAAAEANDEEE